MNQRNSPLSLRRIAGASLLLIVFGIVATVVTMRTFATATLEFAGPMRDRMRLEQNGGVPMAVVRNLAKIT